MDRKRKVIPVDSLLQLRQRLDRLPPKSPERANQIAALKLRTTNKQGRHLSTQQAIRLLEDYGVETAKGGSKRQKAC